MSLVWIIYLINVVASISVVLGIVFFISVAILVVGGIGAVVFSDFEGSTTSEVLKKVLKPSLIVAIVVGSVGNFVPDKKTAYTMLAAYGIEGLSGSEEAMRLGKKSLKLIEQELDSYLKDKVNG